MNNCILQNLSFHLSLIIYQIAGDISHILSLGIHFNIKISSYQYRKPHCGDKMSLWLPPFHNGSSYTGKIASLYWMRAQHTEYDKSLLHSLPLFWMTLFYRVSTTISSINGLFTQGKQLCKWANIGWCHDTLVVCVSTWQFINRSKMMLPVQGSPVWGPV